MSTYFNKEQTGYRSHGKDVGQTEDTQIKIDYSQKPVADWVDTEAYTQAKKLANTKLTINQLRKFYGEVKNIERMWKSRTDSSDNAFREILPLVKILKAKAAYAKARDSVPEEFVGWLHGHVDAVDGPKNFKIFLLHFEAVVGFFYNELDKKEKTKQNKRAQGRTQR